MRTRDSAYIMVSPMLSSKEGFLRRFGCGWFIREFLPGKAPGGSLAIALEQGTPHPEINFEYKEALALVTARELAERIISHMVVCGADITEEDAQRSYEHELKR
ncbi:hypothetical protein ACFLV5_02045 [Chloroflexota bacterium]